MAQADWQHSQTLGYLKPLNMDTDFIHMCTEEQIGTIVEKFWQDTTDIVIAKIDSQKLQGDLKYETNPGGKNKYYHLYNGSIPLDAVADIKLWNAVKHERVLVKL